MSYKKLKKLSVLVESVLRKNEHTRSSDLELIKEVYKELGTHENTPFDFVLYSISHGRLPCFESIGRCRRKLQEQGIYRPSKETEKARRELELSVKGQILNWGKP